MPEGDTIHRAAATLRPFVEGRTIESADRNDRSPLDVTALPGRILETVEPRGKHLLMHLDDGLVIHSHMGMTGSWHLYEHDAEWRKPRSRAWLVMRFERVDAVCFTPKILELLSPDGLRRHAMLRGLGPDVLSPTFDVTEVVERFRAASERPIGEAILDQRNVSGIGNVYKSEVLFLERIDPFGPVGSLSDETLERIIRTSRRLAFRNLDGRPRRTRFRSDGDRKWVYGRSGEPCPECGATIKLRRQGDLGRTTYFCSKCQPPGVVSDDRLDPGS